MKIPQRVQRIALLVLAFGGGLWAADAMLTSDPATQPTTAPSTQATIDSAARPVVDRMLAAYAKCPLTVEATLGIDFDVAGIVEQRSSRVLGSALSPTQFSHEVEGEVRIVSDGNSEHIYDIKQNVYLTTKYEEKDADKAPSDNAKAMLREQNPALLAAISTPAQDAMFTGAERVSLDPNGASQSASGKALDVLLSTDGQVMRKYFVEKQTGLIDRIEVDFAPMLNSRGAREVKRANATIAYAKTDQSTPPEPTAFAFKPPADAVEARAPSEELLVAQQDLSNELVGKPAPELEALDTNGNKVSLAALKGKVVIVDFWATWCVPCLQALKVLNELAPEYKDKDVVILAVNVEEEPDVVKEFVKQRAIPNLTFLLNEDGSIAKRYGVKALPQSFVIGTDGVIRDATAGVKGDMRQEYVKKIEAALKGE